MPTQDLTFLNPGPTNQPVGVNMLYPVMQWFPTEGGTAIYVEQREISGEFWIATNMTYNTYSNQWLPVDPTRACTALVKSSLNNNLVMRTCAAGVTPCVFSQGWAISDSGLASMALAVSSLPLNVDMSPLGIYNVCAPAFGMVAGVNTTTQAALNTTALQAACTAAVTNGGSVFVPTSPNGDYYVNPGINITSTSNRQFGMFGTTDKAAFHVPVTSGGGTLFTIQTTGSQIGSVTFTDLAVHYDSPLTGTAFFVNGAQNCVFERINFYDCPTAVNASDTLTCELNDCTSQSRSQMNCQTIIVGGSSGSSLNNQFHMTSCTLLSQVGLDSTGLVIGKGVVWYISDTSIQSYDNCDVQILGAGGQGSRFGIFTDCTFYAQGTTVWIQPGTGPQGTPNSSHQIEGIKFVSCTFRHGTWQGAYDNLPGVYIDSGGGPASNCTAISFTDCTCDGFGGAGYFVNVAQHIKWVGGRCTGNNLGLNGTQGNITVAGAATGIEITGTSCVGSTGYEPGTAPYGISLGGGVQNVFIQQANVRSCTVAGMVFNSPGSNIQILNCPGYNDQGTLVTATAPAAGSYGSAQFGTTPYYGPVLVSFVGATTVSVGASGQNVAGKTSGDIYLVPGGTDMLAFTGAPSAFVVIGK